MCAHRVDARDCSSANQNCRSSHTKLSQKTKSQAWSEIVVVRFKVVHSPINVSRANGPRSVDRAMSILIENLQVAYYPVFYMLAKFENSYCA